MRFDQNSNSLVLSDFDTRRWGADELFRANVRELCRAWARKLGTTIKLYAAPSCGGYTLEECEPCAA